jgi:hypothetical protein
MITLTLGDLRVLVTELLAQGYREDLEVIVRVQDDDGCFVGGLFSVDVEDNCAGDLAVMLDGHQDAECRGIDEDDTEGAITRPNLRLVRDDGSPDPVG